MKHSTHKYEQDLISDFIKFLRTNNYQITLKPNVKSYEKLNSINEHEQTMVKFHFDLIKPSDDRLEQEIKMFILTNVNRDK
jgi:hypothetical protein